jgi:uncharacterized protein with FMN-binding domain
MLNESYLKGERMKKRNQIIFGIIGIIVLLLLIFGLNFYFKMKNYKQRIASIKIQDVNINKVKNGKYIGEFKTDFVYIKLKVIVYNGKIKNIKVLENKNEKSGKIKIMTKRIKQYQSLNVDTISGSTASSKIILKATENALTKGLKKE